MSRKPIKVTWGDQSGTINEREAFLACEAIEEHLTLFELIAMQSDLKQLKTAKLSRAYAGICAIAGVNVSAMDIKSGMSKSFREAEGKEYFEMVQSVIGPLVVMLTEDGPKEQASGDEAEAAGNVEASTS